MYNWPYPISLTMIHMAFCSSLAFVLVRVVRVVEPVAMSLEMYVSSVLPIGALYAMSLWFSNSAYIYLSVSFIQMLKALMPVAVYTLGVAFQKDVFRCSTMSNMLLVSVGVGIAAYGEANFNFTGVLLQLAAVAFEATRLVLIQILLASKGISLNPITSLYYVSPTCLIFLTVPWFFVEYPSLAPHLAAPRPDLLVFGGNCVCAFALNLAVFLLIGKTSALTMNVAGVVKDWLLIAFSWSVIKDRVTAINLFGYLLAFGGVCWYNHSKLQEMKSKDAARKAAQLDEEEGLIKDSQGSIAIILNAGRRAKLSAGFSPTQPSRVVAGGRRFRSLSPLHVKLARDLPFMSTLRVASTGLRIPRSNLVEHAPTQTLSCLRPRAVALLPRRPKAFVSRPSFPASYRSGLQRVCAESRGSSSHECAEEGRVEPRRAEAEGGVAEETAETTVAESRGVESAPAPSAFPSLLPASTALLSAAFLAFSPLTGGFDLSGPGSVVEAVGVLALIVAVHEAGHFLAARSLGVHVTKFSIGFGPVLAKYQGKGKDGTTDKGVEYALRAFPLGGFVGFPDDDPSEEAVYPPDDPDLLKNRPLADRAFVISAGVIANIVFAYALLFTQVNTVGLIQQVYQPGVLVPDVVYGSAGERAGLLPGDLVVAADGRALEPSSTAVSDLVSYIRASPGRPISLDVLRSVQAPPLSSGGVEGELTGVSAAGGSAAGAAASAAAGEGEKRVVSIRVVPDVSFRDGGGRIGVQLAPNSYQEQERADNLLAGTVAAAKEFARLMGAVVDGLQQILFNFGNTADRVSGPVAIVAVGAEVARTNLSGLFQFAAIVNLNLAVVNLLPLPALDGGYLALLVVEAVRGGKKIPVDVERGIMSSGFLALLGAGIFLIVKDTINLGFL
ncbi:unnamed protein product [Closterium sp. Yama58-4]|nr:unnamed protein product [Closterium sp. Yama58-4]